VQRQSVLFFTPFPHTQPLSHTLTHIYTNADDRHKKENRGARLFAICPSPSSVQVPFHQIKVWLKVTTTTT